MTAPLATVVMYHQIFPEAGAPFPGLKGLDLARFREQLAYIRRHYTPVSALDLAAAVSDGRPLPPRPIVLTFDDGYRGHYEHVLPTLREFDMPGAFFPVASALLERQLLDVNRIQCVLAAASDVDVLVDAIDGAIEEREGAGARADYRARWWKSSRWDPPEIVYVKRLLQHALPEDTRRALIERFFRAHVSTDEPSIADTLYMDVDQVRDLHAAGMVIGAHGDRHVRLPTLSREDQAREIDGALRVLDAVGVSRRGFAYCYANGEHDAHSVELLRARHCAIAFTTRPDLATLTAENVLTLPRLDANDIPTSS